LIWFALGAGTAALLSWAANWYLNPIVLDDERVAFLILTEPLSQDQPSSEATEARNDSIADHTGEILRECGARVFETTGLYPDHAPTAELPMIHENYGSLECIIKAAHTNGINLTVETRWSSPAADEMRSAN